MPIRRVSSIRIPYFLIIAIGIVFGLFLLVAYHHQAFAQTQIGSQPVKADESYDTFLRNVNNTNQTGQMNTDSLYGAVMINRIALGIIRITAGDLATNDQSLKTGNNGLIGFAGDAMGTMYANPPASGVAYVADMAQTAHIIPPTYAAGTAQQGFDRIGGLRPLWSAMRDLAYVFYIPIFVYMGIMIMLRQKVGSAVASVQSALPRIALSLVLVTFSFAIVGFMIDIMNYSMALTVNYFQTKQLIDPNFGGNGKTFETLYNSNLFGFAWDSDKLNVQKFADLPAKAVGDVIKHVLKESFITNILAGSFDFIAKAVITIALVFMLWKTLIELIKAYISILLMTILGPLLIAFNAVPGSTSASSWFKNIVANLSVFPAVLAVMLFASIVGNVSNISGPGASTTSYVYNSSSGWVPPFLGGFTDNGVGDITGLIGFGAIMILPTLLQTMQKFFKSSGGATTYLAPVGEALGVLGALRKAATSSKHQPGYSEPTERREKGEKTNRENSDV